MGQLDRRIEVDGEDVKVVAADELRAVGLVGGKTSMTRSANSAQQSSFWRYLWDRRATIFSLTMRHLLLVAIRSEEHTSELQSLRHLVCRLLLEKKKA